MNLFINIYKFMSISSWIYLDYQNKTGFEKELDSDKL